MIAGLLSTDFAEYTDQKERLVLQVNHDPMASTSAVGVIRTMFTRLLQSAVLSPLT
jgi:hypothetical protein